MSLIEEVKKKKEFSGLPYSIVARALKESGDDVKETRKLLRKYFGVFLTNRVLKGKGDLLEAHMSSKKRCYEEFYDSIFSMQNHVTSGAAFRMEGKNKISIVDLGCGVNGFSYEFLPKGTRYVGVEAAGQLVDQMNSFFVENGFDAEAICGDLFDLDLIRKILRSERFDVCFLFQVVDALESIERNFSLKLVAEIMKNVKVLVLSVPLVSLGGGKKFAVKRKWLMDFLEEEFVVEKDFEMFGERVLVVRKK
ncbi:MAG: class I SAM-dependent methyltransferase [archaeon]